MFNIILTGALCIGAFDVEVEVLEGSGVSGTLVELSSEQLVVDDAGKKTTLPVKTLSKVTPVAPPAAFSAKAAVSVELVDGSTLKASRYSVAGGKAQIELLGGENVEVETRSIRSVLLKADTNKDKLAVQWQEILDTAVKGDVLVVRKSVVRREGEKDVKVEMLDFLEGLLFDVTADNVQFEFDGDRVDVKREKVEGLIYYHPVGRELPAAVCRVNSADGSRFNAQSLETLDNRLKLVTAAGMKVSLRLDDVQALDFAAGNTVYLSDLEPESVEWSAFLDASKTSPLLARLYQPRKDRGFDGKKLKLRVAGDPRPKEFNKGLAIHSRTLMIYRLDGKFRRFQALAGIDASVKEAGHVRLVIHGDTKQLFEGVISGDADAVPLDLDVTDCRRLKILVDFGDDLDIADHLDLCNARVIK